MYTNDSFYALTNPQQIGVVILSLSMFTILVWATRALTKNKGLALKIIIPLGLFYLFVWLAPQIYYTYYFLTFDNLGMQNVIKAPPNPIDIVKFLSFQDRATFSAHSKGLLGLTMIAISIAPILKSLRHPKAR